MAISTGGPQKITGAPDYDHPEFWNDRFATGQDVGEWLNSGEALIDAVVFDLESRPMADGRPRVLHLGPGVSQLGLKLRDACVERHWKGNGIVVSLAICRTYIIHNPFPLIMPISCRTSISPEKLFVLDKIMKVKNLHQRRCIGNGLICYRGATFRSFYRSPRST